MPTERFELTDAERLIIETLGAEIAAMSQELARHHLFSLAQCCPGNATMNAFESWLGPEGYGTRHHRRLKQLIRRLEQTLQGPTKRAKRILSQRIRKPRAPTSKPQA